MLHRSKVVTRPGRLVSCVLLSMALVMGATACSGNDDSPGSSSSTSDLKKAAHSLDAGLKAHADGHLTKAAAEYRRVLTYDPDNKYAYYNLALVDAASGNYGLAEQKYRKAIDADPRYEPALFNLAILRTARDPQEAMALYRRAVAAKPKDASAWLNLGLLLRAAGQTNEGNKAVVKAIALDPRLKDPARK